MEDALDRIAPTATWGAVTVDIAYGGAFYAFLSADSIGLDLKSSPMRAIVDAGESLKTNKKIRAVVLSGEGASFCAGLDLAAQMKGAKGSLGNLGSLDTNPGEFEIRDAPPIVAADP